MHTYPESGEPSSIFPAEAKKTPPPVPLPPPVFWVPGTYKVAGKYEINSEKMNSRVWQQRGASGPGGEQGSSSFFLLSGKSVVLKTMRNHGGCHFLYVWLGLVVVFFFFIHIPLHMVYD